MHIYCTPRKTTPKLPPPRPGHSPLPPAGGGVGPGWAPRSAGRGQPRSPAAPRGQPRRQPRRRPLSPSAPGERGSQRKGKKGVGWGWNFSLFLPFPLCKLSEVRSTGSALPADNPLSGGNPPPKATLTPRPRVPGGPRLPVPARSAGGRPAPPGGGSGSVPSPPPPPRHQAAPPGRRAAQGAGAGPAAGAGAGAPRSPAEVWEEEERREDPRGSR